MRVRLRGVCLKDPLAFPLLSCSARGARTNGFGDVILVNSFRSNNFTDVTSKLRDVMFVNSLRFNTSGDVTSKAGA